VLPEAASKTKYYCQPKIKISAPRNFSPKEVLGGLRHWLELILWVTVTWNQCESRLMRTTWRQ